MLTSECRRLSWSGDFRTRFVFGRPRLIWTDTFDFSPSFFTSNGNTPRLTQYSGADKSLARPGRKQATFPAFYGTWRLITTFTRVHHLSLPKPNQSIRLPITLLTDAACFFPGRAKDLSAPRVVYVPESPALVQFPRVAVEHTNHQLYIYIQGSPVEIQAPTHRNLTGHSMTAPPPVLSPNSILPSP